LAARARLAAAGALRTDSSGEDVPEAPGSGKEKVGAPSVDPPPTGVPGPPPPCRDARRRTRNWKSGFWNCSTLSLLRREDSGPRVMASSPSRAWREGNTNARVGGGG
jgi:hypothetical protein